MESRFVATRRNFRFIHLDESREETNHKSHTTREDFDVGSKLDAKHDDTVERRTTGESRTDAQEDSQYLALTCAVFRPHAGGRQQEHYVPLVLGVFFHFVLHDCHGVTVSCQKICSLRV